MNELEKGRFKLAKHLNKDLDDIDAMPFYRFLEWMKFLKSEQSIDTTELMLARVCGILANRPPFEFLISLDESEREFLKQKHISESLMKDLE